MGKIPQLPLTPSLPKVNPFSRRPDWNGAMDDNTRGFPPLSSRETECLRHLARGMTVEEIAGVVGVSKKSAEKYIQKAKEKTGATPREQAVAIAIKHNIL